ncbi:Glu-tRNA(Gln) amidotransferase subunit GatD [Candidatus Woesearchaeota archaeon]|nr:Glu-tRNA(Gln) amidotransferase subunit GatD [Candidatus Woesearchaeota archaeon]
MKSEYGDIVKVHTDEQTYEGILMPRPDIFEKDHTIIKLGNGYNIGIQNDKIIKIEVIKKYEKKKEEKTKLSHKKGLPTVSILSFGGTISSRVDYKTGGVYADYTAEDFVAMLPELKEISNLRTEKVMGIMSEDMSPEDWQIMARRIAKELNDSEVSGVIVTQGTDTLHFSTAAMSFFLRNLNKPVIFTAAQRSIDRGSSDALSNLLCAVHTAAKFDGAAVVTCMHGTSDDEYCILSRGTKVRKMHTSRRDAFRPINELPLAKVYENGNIEILNGSYPKRSNDEVEVVDNFEHKTALLYVHPGIDPDILDYYRQKKYKGIVIAATALGHVPTIKPKYALIKKIKELIDNGVPVVIASQTIYGRVHPYVYTNLRKLSVELNCIFAEDMLPETAYIKLGWVLPQAKNIEEVKDMMLTNYAGEITERIDERAFLY